MRHFVKLPRSVSAHLPTLHQLYHMHSIFPKGNVSLPAFLQVTKAALAWRVAGGALACLCAFDLVRTHQPICKTGAW